MGCHNEVGFHRGPAYSLWESVAIGYFVFGIGDGCFIHVRSLAGYGVVVNSLF